MTMLDRMRRHKGWLKWSLALVVLAFIIFYIPAFLGKGDPGTGGSQSDMVASVGGREITVDEFQRAYQAQIQMYRGAYGGNISEQMLKQLGIDQQILQQMVDEAGVAGRGEAAEASTSRTTNSSSASSPSPPSRRTASSSARRATPRCCGCSGRR